MATNLVTPSRRKRRKAPTDEAPELVTKNVVVLRRGQVREIGDEVMMPHTTIDMSIIKRQGQFKKVSFEMSNKSEDVGRKLVEAFDFLVGQRFYCARKEKNRTQLDFVGNRRIWSGKEIHDFLEGNSALYIFSEEQNGHQHTSLIGQVENMQISKNESSSEDCSDPGYETGNTQDSSRNHGDPLLSRSINSSPQLLGECRANCNVQLFYPLNKVEKTVNDYSETDDSINDVFKAASTISMPVSLAPNNAEIDQTNQEVAQENYHSNVEAEEANRNNAEQGNSHSLMEVVEPTQDVEQEQMVREICPSSGPLEGGVNFLISLKEDLPEHITSGYADFGDKRVDLKKFNRLTFKGTIPAAQEPGVVAVDVFSDTGQFLGETTFKYEDMREKVVSQAVEQGGDGVYDLISLIGKHAWNRSLSMKQNAEQATGALNGSCQKRSLSAENTVTDDEYKDLGQHFQDIVTWLSEESFHPSHSNTDVWLKLSEAFYGLCQKLDFVGDKQNFTGDQHASPQGNEDSYFADTETSSCTSSNSASQSDPEDWSQLLNVSSLSLPLPNTKPGIPKIAVSRSEPTEHLDKVSDKETNESHEILALLTGFISQPSVHETLDDGNEKHPRWNTSSSEPQRIDDNLLNDDHNAVEDITKKCELSSEERNPYIHSTLLESAPMFSDTIVPEKESGKNVHSRWEILSMEPNKTDGGVEEDTFDTEQDLSLEQGLFSEEGNVHTHLSLPDDTSVQIHRLEVENEESQEEQIQVSNQFSTDSEQSGAHITPPPVCSNASDIPKMIPMTLPLALQPNLPTGDSTEQMNCSTLLSGLKSLKISGKDKEFQKSHEQAYTETFPVKESLSGQPLRQFRSLKTQVSAKEASVSAVTKDNQQHTPVTVGASDDQLIGYISIIQAAEKGYSDTVRRLIEKGADVDQRGRVSSGDTPLTAAAKNGHSDIVRLLIENGADVNKQYWFSGETPLTVAAKNGHTDIVRLLTENGADVNKANKSFADTPLTAAAKNGHSDIVRLLIENGADVNKQYRT